MSNLSLDNVATGNMSQVPVEVPGMTVKSRKTCRHSRHTETFDRSFFFVISALPRLSVNSIILVMMLINYLSLILDCRLSFAIINICV